MDKKNSTPNIIRVEENIDTLSTFSDPAARGWTRTAFSPWYKEGREWVKEQMKESGLSVRVDAAANIIGRLEGKEAGTPCLMIGSHTDTVRNGGRFDGMAGVIAGLEVVRMLRESGTHLRHPIEIVDFTAEEPTEFGISTIGSKAMAGNLTNEMLALTDPADRRLGDVLQEFGGNMDALPNGAKREGDIDVYLELHIEQGPVLEQTGNVLGVVTGIVGIKRFLFHIVGRADHAGTTPMDKRLDALPGASEIVLAVESLCRQHMDGPLVGTVGALTVQPNSPNVVPQSVTLNTEIRSIHQQLIDAVSESIIKEAASIAEKRDLNFRWEQISGTPSVQIDRQVFDIVEQNCRKVTNKTLTLPSGAGHDANQIAYLAPVGMIFVPSKAGRSHCPEEWTEMDHLLRGIEALYTTVLELDRRS